eukprot:TRINITY_DN7009_c0_g1_i1.p1 TRINITY_DN7009_c0_g1~~TRINITY_DN7009_c0_g1_i1.p1  ORF type:complete len:1625 (-),score=357.84 TRINITY_DN7009_c0_g1_i1:217-5091(-)
MATLTELAGMTGMSEKDLISAKTLDLSGLGLSSLHSAVLLLSNLQELSLANNAISYLPDDISRLKMLRTINVSRNHLTTIPATLFAMPLLDSLIVTDNRLSYEDTLACDAYNFESNHLSLASRNLSVVPPIVTSMTRLKSLDLSGNSISCLPKSISNLQNLRELNLQNNRLSVFASYAGKKRPNVRKAPVNAPVVEENVPKPSSIPPEVCLMECDIILEGNYRIPLRVIQKLPLIIQNPFFNTLEKSLRILGLLRSTDNHNKDLAAEYEEFSLRQFHRMCETQSVDSIINMRVIKLATRANAAHFLSDGRIVEQTLNLWSNRSSMQTFLNQELQRTSWWEDGFWKGAAYFATAFFYSAGRFLVSPKAKYIFSVLLYLIYAVSLTSYIVENNSTHDIPTYVETESIKHRYYPENVEYPDDFWVYMEKLFVRQAFEPLDARGHSGIVPPGQQSLETSFDRIVGKVRMRQLRSRIEPCSENYDDTDTGGSNTTYTEVSLCVRPFSTENEETNPYGPNGCFLWSSQSGTEAATMYGEFGIIYPGSGYVEYLDQAKADASQKLAELKSNYWVDLQTRAVFVEFLVSNDNVDTISLVNIMFEFSVSGDLSADMIVHTAPKQIVESSRVNVKYNTIILTFFALGFLLHEMELMWSFHSDFIKEVRTFLDLLITSLVFLVFGLRVRMLLIDASSAGLGPSTNISFLDLQRSINTWTLQCEVLSGLLFLSWIRLLFFAILIPKMGSLLLSMSNLVSKMLNYMTIIIVVLVAFGTAMYAIYGSVLESYSSIDQVAFAVGKFLFADFGDQPFRDEEAYLGPCIFFGFLVICAILLTNFLIAIMGGSYQDAKQNAKLDYRRVFAKNIIYYSKISAPIPLNVLWPAIALVHMAWESIIPILDFAALCIISGWKDRMLCWNFLWNDRALGQVLRSKWPIPNTSIFRNYVDNIGMRHTTIWMDYLIYLAAWLAACAFSVLHYPCRKLIFAVAGDRATELLLQSLDDLEQDMDLEDDQFYTAPSAQMHQPVKRSKKHKVRFVSMILGLDILFYRILLRLLWICSILPWMVFFAIRFAWAVIQTRKAHSGSSGLERTDGQPVNICSSGRVVSKTDEQLCTLKSPKPFRVNDGIRYFEIEFLHSGTIAGVGLVAAQHATNVCVGKAEYSIGLLSTGELWYHGSLVDRVSRVWADTGTIVGCGIDYGKNQIFFSLNGRILLHLPVLHNFLARVTLYPALTLQDFGSAARVNFGLSSFKLTAPSYQPFVLNKWTSSSPLVHITSDGQIASLCRKPNQDSAASSACVVAYRPFSKRSDVAYFDVEVAHWGHDSHLTVGLICKRRDDKVHLGESYRTVGFSVDMTAQQLEIAWKFDRSQQGSQIEFLEDACTMQRVGCGVNRQSGVIFFTINGRLLDCFLRLPPKYSRRFYAAVCMHSYGQIVSAGFHTSAPDSHKNLHRKGRLLHPQSLSATPQVHSPFLATSAGMTRGNSANIDRFSHSSARFDPTVFTVDDPLLQNPSPPTHATTNAAHPTMASASASTSLLHGNNMMAPTIVNHHPHHHHHSFNPHIHTLTHAPSSSSRPQSPHVTINLGMLSLSPDVHSAIKATASASTSTYAPIHGVNANASSTQGTEAAPYVILHDTHL